MGWGWKTKPSLWQRMNIPVGNLLCATTLSTDLLLHGKEAPQCRIIHRMKSIIGIRSEFFIILWIKLRYSFAYSSSGRTYCSRSNLANLDSSSYWLSSICIAFLIHSTSELMSPGLQKSMWTCRFLDSSISCSNARHTYRSCFKRCKTKVFLGVGWGDHPFGFASVAMSFRFADKSRQFYSLIPCS